MPPKPKHHHKPHHPHPPHAKSTVATSSRSGKLIVAIASFAISTLIAFLCAMLMNYFAISINVILPVIAPVWVGVATISYMVMSGS